MTTRALISSNWLLLFIPVAVGLNRFDAHPLVVFIASALAIVPLAKLIGDATEVLAALLGPAKGGMLSAALGNAPEIIIGLFALKKGLVDMVKASITGSLVGNLLFGMGIAMFAGGLRFPRLAYDTRVTRVHSDLLMLAMFGLIVPAVFHLSATSEREISLEIAMVLFLVYLASVVYTLHSENTSTDAPAPTETDQAGTEARENVPEPGSRSRNKAIGVVTVATAGLAVMSEILTDAIGPAAAGLHLTPLFAGIFLLALVGNAAELFAAVRFARANQLDVSIGMTVGASTQTALLVAPILVFAGFLLEQDMNLLFSTLELVAIVMSIAVIQRTANSGTATWLEGLVLIAVYLMLGFGFFYLPHHAA